LHSAQDFGVLFTFVNVERFVTLTPERQHPIIVLSSGINQFCETELINGLEIVSTGFIESYCLRLGHSRVF
jgi:hypothetical protein